MAIEEIIRGREETINLVRSVNKGTSTGINRPIVKMYSLENCELRHNENAGKHICK